MDTLDKTARDLRDTVNAVANAAQSLHDSAEDQDGTHVRVPVDELLFLRIQLLRWSQASAAAVAEMQRTTRIVVAHPPCKAPGFAKSKGVVHGG